MKLIDKYKKLKSDIIAYQNANNPLDDHKMEDTGLYRVHYVEFDRKTNGSISTQYVGDTYKMSLPMSQKEILDVISFLFDHTHNVLGLDKKSYSATHIVDFIMETDDKYKFTRVKNANKEDIIDLYVVGGSNKLFKKSRYYNTYFDWHNPNITYEDVQEIYRKYGIEINPLADKKLSLSNES